MQMTGWKSKWGAIIAAIGAALTAAAQVSPEVMLGNTMLSDWMQFAGILITGFGTALLGVGIAHKVEKAGAKEEVK